MHERRRQCLRVELHLGEDHRDGQRMDDVRLARLASNSVVGRLGEMVGALNERGVHPGVVSPDDLQQRVKVGLNVLLQVL